MCLLCHKYGKIDPDGFQYCIKCGKASKPHPCENGHMWKILDKYKCSENDGYIDKQGIKFVSQCTVCGEIKSKWVT